MQTNPVVPEYIGVSQVKGVADNLAQTNARRYAQPAGSFPNGREDVVLKVEVDGAARIGRSEDLSSDGVRPSGVFGPASRLQGPSHLCAIRRSV
jgi:hypothetical protein